LDVAPLRIECYDISNLQSTEIVASMVVFEDGLPRKSEYRRFTIRQAGQSDVAAMNQVIRRRLERLLRSRPWGSPLHEPRSGEALGGERSDDTESDDALTTRKFAYRPSLIVVDGGPTQVAAAKRAFDDLGIQTNAPDGVALCGLAKRLEEIWLPDATEPVVLPRNSEALYLMQRVRDEAHRFANTHHRERRGRAMTVSALDGITGLGPTRRAALMKKFGSVTKIRAATADEIAKVPGIGRATAESIVSQLAHAKPGPAINMATGEIVEGE
jgi:excinuclease ABC subunit C